MPFIILYYSAFFQMPKIFKFGLNQMVHQKPGDPEKHYLK